MHCRSNSLPNVAFRFTPQVSPFDAAAVTLLIGGAIVISSWSENFGDPNDKVGTDTTVCRPLTACRSLLLLLMVLPSHVLCARAAGQPGGHSEEGGRRNQERPQDCTAGGDAVPVRGLHVHIRVPGAPKSDCCPAKSVPHPRQPLCVCSHHPRQLVGPVRDASIWQADTNELVVLQWTPALSPNGEHLPHGMIFSCFMVSSMVGSAIAGRLLGSSKCALGSPLTSLVLGFAASTATDVRCRCADADGWWRSTETLTKNLASCAGTSQKSSCSWCLLCRRRASSCRCCITAPSQSRQTASTRTPQVQ